MKVAVLGAGGFIGQRASEWLHLTGRADVVPIVRSHAAGARVVRLGLEYRVADALDEASLSRALEDCDVLLDTVVGDARTIEDGPAFAVHAARNAAVRRIVYLSTGMVYGYRPTPQDDDETPPRSEQPLSYNRSKAIAEERIHQLRRSTGVDIVILRPTIVYGPRSALFTVRPAADILGGSAFLVDGGVGICNAVYVDNLVTAMWLAATSPEAANQTFVISDRERVTWADLYRSVADAIHVDFESIQQVSSSDFPPDYGQLRANRVVDLLRTPRAQALRARIPTNSRRLSAPRALGGQGLPRSRTANRRRRPRTRSTSSCRPPDTSSLLRRPSVSSGMTRSRSRRPPSALEPGSRRWGSTPERRLLTPRTVLCGPRLRPAPQTLARTRRPTPRAALRG